MVEDLKLREIVEQASKLPVDQRKDFLDSTCGDDSPLRAQAQLLLGQLETQPDVTPELSGTTLPRNAPTSATDLPGVDAQIGPYRLLDRVGEGGMGTVYRAEQRHPIRRIVAVKVIRGEFGSRNVIARFEAERQALARMDHPNIAKILDAGTHAGLPFFVMELVPGAPITRFCDQQQMSIHDRLNLFIQACDAIAHAHTKAILHRDIKSSNMLAYLSDGKPLVKVIDFGIAKALTDDSLNDQMAQTQVGRAIGTYESMSPEQAAGVADIDTRTDVYALGVLLYELICGVKPFAGTMVPGIHELEVHRIISEVQPPLPSARVGPQIAKERQTGQAELTRLLRSELEWIPMKALRKERDRRYASVSQLAEDVRNYLAGLPLLAGPDTRGYRLNKFVRRNKRLIAAASTVVIVLLLGITGTTVGLVRANRQKRAAELATIEADRQRDNANAVVSFLTDDVIERASRGHAANKNVRDVLVNALLIPASEQVQKRFAGKPLVEASVRDMLALTLNDLDRSDLALPHAKAAYELRLASLGENHRDSIAALSDYAFVLQSAGHAADAEPLYKKGLAQCQATFGEDNALTIQLLGNYAEDVKVLGRLTEAQSLYERAVADARRVFGNDDSRTLVLQSNYAALLLMLGRNADALTLLHDSWTASQRLFGDNDDDTVMHLDRYTVALCAVGRPADAEPLAYQAWQRRKTALGDEHPDTVESLNNYAQVLQNLKRSPDALPLARQAWEQRQKSLGDDAPDTRISLNNYAHVLASVGQLPQAIGYFKQLYECDLRLQGRDDPATANALRTYAQALKGLGKWPDAEPLFKELWERNQRVLGNDDPETIAACNRYADALFALDRPGDAEPVYRQAVEAADKNKSMGHTDSRTKLFAANDAKCLDRLNRPAEAQALRNRFGLDAAPTSRSRP